MPDHKTPLETISTTVQILSVVAGVVISVVSFNDARQNEAKARELEAQAREFEAAKPFYTLRQNLYAEAVKAAGVLANPQVHTPAEIAKSRTRFRELYVAELSMVEEREVEAKMVALARQIDPDLMPLDSAQAAAYDLAHALRDTFTRTWKVTGK